MTRWLSFRERALLHMLVFSFSIASIVTPHIRAWHAVTIAHGAPITLEQRLNDLKMEWQEREKEGKKNLKHIHIAANRIRSVLCEQGQQQHCHVKELTGKRIDIDKLAYAVAVAETNNCTKGTGISKNNCHGIQKWGQIVYYHSKQESFRAFKRIWLEKYGDRLPTMDDAKQYTNGEGTRWYNVVRTAYLQADQ